jgi:hypothetical protein
VEHISSHGADDLDLPYEKVELSLARSRTDDHDENAQSVVRITGPERNDFAVGCGVAPHQPVRGGNSRTFDVPIDQSIQTFIEAFATRFLRICQSGCRQSQKKRY